MPLQHDHIDYIIKDLHYRGIVADGIQEELIDHVCSAVEVEMENGTRFIDAYQEVISRFGHTSGLRKTQKETLQSENSNTPMMLKNYLTIAFRNLRKQGFYTFINVAGLAVGVASCLIILLYVINELSYDRHHKDADRIYRVDAEIKFGANHLRLAVSPAPLADAMRNDWPQVEAATRLWNDGSILVKRSDQNIKETDVIFADSSIFSVFTIPLVKGDPTTALKEPYSIVLSEKSAQKYFPGEDPIGQSLIIENKDNYKITGVYRDMPTTSHFHYEMMRSLTSTEYHKDGSWLSNNFTTYLKLRPGTDARAFEANFPKMVDKYAGPQARMALGDDFTMEKFRATGNKLDWTLRPLTDIHLHSDMTAELGVNSDITYVYLFSAVALFILVIACINFMNLSTARSANRAKEVGVRKVMGSLRSHLVRQFLTESILLSAFSFMLALLLAALVLPSFNDLAGRQLSLPVGDPRFWGALALTMGVVGALAGTYPSVFLSGFKPVNVLKGNLSLGMKSGGIRSGLVVFQFFISIVLIIGTIAVNRQLGFIQTKRIGFNKDQVIVVKDAYAIANQLETFKQEVLKNSRIISGTISGFLPVEGTNRNDNTHWPEGVDPNEANMVSLQCWRVDYDYLKTLGIEIKTGRGFSPEFPSDSNAVILNEAALELFGFPEDAVGKKISTFADDPTNPNNKPIVRSIPVVGVVKNFHFESLKDNITPLAFFLRKSTGLVSFRFQAGDVGGVVTSIEEVWKKMAPDMPFSYTFLDDDFSRMYSAEQRLGQIFTIFASLAIVIACLGLFALSAFTAEQRTKEIGIRKVLGASVTSIVVLLSKEFGKLIMISFVLAAPLAWYGVDWWLSSYTYKTEVGVMVFLLSGVGALTIALLTMSYQSIKAAVSNPVNSLRSE